MMHTIHAAPNKPGQPAKYPVRMLAVGESMFFDGVSVTKIGNAVRHHKDMAFRCKTLVRHGVKGVRVWRIR